MASKILHVWRPTVIIPGTEAAGVPALADSLIVKLDLDSDGARITEATLPFADYAGLEAEWEAGVATTVLEAALDDWGSSPGPPEDPIPEGQRGIRNFTPFQEP